MLRRIEVGRQDGSRDKTETDEDEAQKNQNGNNETARDLPPKLAQGETRADDHKGEAKDENQLGGDEYSQEKQQQGNQQRGQGPSAQRQRCEFGVGKTRPRYFFQACKDEQSPPGHTSQDGDQELSVLSKCVEAVEEYVIVHEINLLFWNRSDCKFVLLLFMGCYTRQLSAWRSACVWA